ncbi:MAG: molybdopterin-dependent oxidoreductase [Acidobacteriota bacterium]|nr:molybdopterin-dependent oxidoreductase [Acidobacteriota bacterium]
MPSGAAGNIAIRHSVCALDCPDACALLINVDEAGRGSKLRGDPAHPVTRGFLCGKVARYLDREYSPERLLYPRRRVDSKGEARFSRISWDEALHEIAERLKSVADEYGPEAILPYSYAGTMGLLNGAGMDRRFFHRLGASRLDRTICSAAGTVGLTDALGVRYGIEPEQFRHAKLVIAWGANILGTNVHLWPFIVEARRNGAKFYTIDPHRNRTGKLTDRHYAIRPGSDAALALAMMHVILAEGLEDRAYVEQHTLGVGELAERVREWTPARAAELTGIAAQDIVELAREYATTRPAAIRLNYGVQRSERGAMAVRTVALLPALTGAWKDVGGGLQLSTSYAFQLNRAALERADLQLASPLRREARVLNMAELGGILTETADPPVKALVVYNSNPAAIAPDQHAVRRGLQRKDLFTVVLEHFQTDTADFADIVLPATTFLEHTDLYFSYGHFHLQLARPALAPPGEALPNVEIFRKLAKLMDFDEPCFSDSDDDMIRTLLDTAHPYLAGITMEQLDREHSVRLKIGDPFLPFANGGFGTPSGKCEFNAATLGYEPPTESRLGDSGLRARFPLEMISPKNDDSMNSTFGFRSDTDRQTAALKIHPADAAARGIAAGDAVLMFNDRGRCMLCAEVSEDISSGVVAAPSVRWPKLAPDGNSVNMLTSQRLTDKGGGPTFYSCLVQVEKIGD